MVISPCYYTNKSSDRKFKATEATVAGRWDKTGKSDNTRTEKGIVLYSTWHREQVRRRDGKKQREKREGKPYPICITDGLALNSLGKIYIASGQNRNTTGNKQNTFPCLCGRV